MLDVGRLRFFNEVARAGSFTEAASRLSYTQSAVSQQIATLEAELGLTLIERGTRPLRLTDAGEVLLRHARSIFDQVATAQAELCAIAGLKTGIVRMAGFSSACATILPTAIATFVREHPNVAVTLTEMRPNAARSALRAGDLDLAVTYEYPPAAPAHDDGLQRVWLGDDHLVIVLAVGHRLAHQQSLGLEHLQAEHWVSAPHSSPAAEHRRHLEERCARATRRLRAPRALRGQQRRHDPRPDRSRRRRRTNARTDTSPPPPGHHHTPARQRHHALTGT